MHALEARHGMRHSRRTQTHACRGPSNLGQASANRVHAQQKSSVLTNTIFESMIEHLIDGGTGILVGPIARRQVLGVLFAQTEIVVLVVGRHFGRAPC